MPKKNPVPEPEEGLKFIDVHCHLPFPRPKRDDKLPSDEKQYEEYFKAGGKYLISSSVDNVTLQLILGFISGKDKLGFTCGWAPQTVTYTPKERYRKEWDMWIDYLRSHQEDYLAIGEIGLDFHHAKTLEKRERQVSEFRKIIELTKNFDKPYVLHVRNANEREMDREHPKHRFNKTDGATKEILNIIKEFNLKPRRIMWHCFSGPEQYGQILSKRGFILSVPSSAFSNNRWRKVTRQSSLNSLVTETDSYYQHPYLRGPINVPSNVVYSIAAIAYSHQVPQKTVSESTIKNAEKFFGLEI